MVKLHSIHLMIDNHSGAPMEHSEAWFDSGRVADGFAWPSSVPDGAKLDVLCYERHWSAAGCSGTVTYIMNHTSVTFGFSNPSVGTNKLGVGISGRRVWENMESHGYSPFDVSLSIGGRAVTCHCRCSGGETNVATVEIVNYALKQGYTPLGS